VLQIYCRPKYDKVYDKGKFFCEQTYSVQLLKDMFYKFVPLYGLLKSSICLLCQGIPTTRAAALVVSKDLVKRDKFYDGNIRKERTAIVLRLAPSWFRIGSFELLARSGEINLLKQLSEFVMKNYFPELSSTVNSRL